MQSIMLSTVTQNLKFKIPLGSLGGVGFRLAQFSQNSQSLKYKLFPDLELGILFTLSCTNSCKAIKHDLLLTLLLSKFVG
jgi:hypothetical protein